MQLISLPCFKESDLNWKPYLPKSEEKKILWHLDCGIDFPLEEELPFKELYLALSLFAKEVFPLYREKTLGVALYQGSIDLSAKFHWTSHQEENWEIWKKERQKLPFSYLRHLFCQDAFAYYFQKLSHALPDELPLYLLFEAVPYLSASEMLHLISKERFEHFQVAAQGIAGWEGLHWTGRTIVPPPSSSCALLFPKEEEVTSALLRRIDQIIQQSTIPIRVVPELFLHDCWEGVDEFLVFSEALSTQGARKLKAFQATGGKVTHLNLENRGRGI